MSGDWPILLNPIEHADSVYRTIVNDAASNSPVQPIVNMGQGFLYILPAINAIAAGNR